jgi:hydroxymethylpyrimidine pyrophosphatase-like HAD family hydrolase
MSRNKIIYNIAVDFDGTVVTHEYPNIGKDIGAVEVLKEIVNKGHKIILFTMRSGKTLEEAVQWFKDNDIPLYGINKNPGQSAWTTSPKAYADIYIDDAAIGAPLIYNEELSKRPFIDWIGVKYILEQEGIL